jgi:ribosomal protein S18 acetylase RimI-like enzyme
MSEPARSILRDYLADVVGRYHGRMLTAAELDAVVSEFPADDLTTPRGVLWIARQDDRPVGCVGLLLSEDRVGVITRLFVRQDCRRLGIARQLMSELEQHSRASGLTMLRLDTRSDLTEARSLYVRSGFTEVNAFNNGPYAEHWFERPLNE